MANGTSPPTNPDYRGATPVAYRIDSSGTLRNASDPLSTGQAFSTDVNPVLQINPQWFNAPKFFVGQDKPAALCKLGVAQRTPLKPLVNQQGWSITYSLLTAPHQDIASQTFTLSDQDAGSLANMPLPGSRGSLTCAFYAYVGGDENKTFAIISNTLKTLQGIIGSTSTQAFLAIPVADVTALTQAESLFEQIVQATAPPKWTQYWMDTRVIPVALSAATAGDGVLSLPLGVTTLIIIPSESNAKDHIQNAADKVVNYFEAVSTYVGNASYKFQLTPNGIVMAGGDSPFDAIPYVALTIEVANPTT